MYFKGISLKHSSLKQLLILVILDNYSSDSLRRSSFYFLFSLLVWFVVRVVSRLHKCIPRNPWLSTIIHNISVLHMYLCPYSQKYLESQYVKSHCLASITTSVHKLPWIYKWPKYVSAFLCSSLCELLLQ
jgi:hypothetical protein